ncbi:MAG: alpha/beta fold hydrolase [Burkholderiales bacterium]
MATSNIRSRWVMANGVKTHYSESGGNGPVLVALHGGGAGSSGVAGMGAAMERLADEFRVIAPDSIGGFGLTDPFAPTPYGLISRVEHLRDFCDALCLDKFTILGNSQGAFAAAHYAMNYTDRIDKMILISSLTIAQALGLSQPPNAAMKALGGYDGTREAMVRLLEALIIDKSRITDALINERQAAATRPGALESFQNLGKAIQASRNDPVMANRIDMRVSLPLLTKQLRTIFLWGDSDPFAIPATGKGVEALLPDVKFRWVAGAGHQVQTDKPDESVKIIRDFLRT